MSDAAEFAPQMVAAFGFCKPEKVTAEEISKQVAALSKKYPTLVLSPLVGGISVRLPEDGVADELALNRIASTDLKDWSVVGQLYFTDGCSVHAGVFTGSGQDRHIVMVEVSESLIRKGIWG